LRFAGHGGVDDSGALVNGHDGAGSARGYPIAGDLHLPDVALLAQRVRRCRASWRAWAMALLGLNANAGVQVWFGGMDCVTGVLSAATSAGWF